MIVVMPMAGRGSRFSSKGFAKPKPLIEVAGKPMFEWALQSLKGLEVRLLIVIALKDHEYNFEISKKLSQIWIGQFQLITIEGVTEGQLCTVLTAEELINRDEGVLIISSDTMVVSEIAKDIQNIKKGVKGLISVLNLPGEQWSFAKTNLEGIVTEVAEKKRISDHASTGMYYFSSGEEFIKFGKKMILENKRTNGEFYIIPVYNELIAHQKIVGISFANEMWDMGTPEAKEIFEVKLRNEKD
jgi:NDP-sugar pyrophosphorylase family protein